MVVDASVLLHVLFGEPGAADTLAWLGRRSDLLIAAPTLLEAEIVYGSHRGFRRGDVAELVDRLRIDVVPFTSEHAREAKHAYARYGKGQHHPARLNFGDCIAYALATVANRPLVYKGDDFLHTDLRLVHVTDLARPGLPQSRR